MRRQLRRPLYQASAPTKGIARPGQQIGNATGMFTCTSRADTTMVVAAVASDATITVASATGIVAGDLIGVLLDNGLTHWTKVSGAPSGAVVTLAAAMPSAAAIGRQVSANRWIAVT